MNKIVSPKITALIFGVLTIVFLAAFYVIAWQEPAQAPPGGNVPTPINVGTDPQAKAGRISATEFYDYNDLSYYLNPSGESKLEGLILSPTSPPPFPQQGQIYFNQTNKILYYYNGTKWMAIVGDCGLCKFYDYDDKECVNSPAGTKDEYCSATHYACDGAGNCTVPKNYTGECAFNCTVAEKDLTRDQACLGRGYEGCYSGTYGGESSCISGGGDSYEKCTLPCGGAQHEIPDWFGCWKWLYD